MALRSDIAKALSVPIRGPIKPSYLQVQRSRSSATRFAYTPLGQSFFCGKPVTHMYDVINLGAMRVLYSDETMRGEISCCLA